MVRRLTLLISMLALAATAGVAQQQQSQGQARRQGQRPARDAAQAPTGSASLAGRVLTADTGPAGQARPYHRFAGGRQSKTTSTDDQGRFRVAEPSRPGPTLSPLSRMASSTRPTVSGGRSSREHLWSSPTDGRSANLDLRLTRGAVITGRVLDEDGEALVRAIVTVERYQYVRGERQLVAAGGGVDRRPRPVPRVRPCCRATTTSARRRRAPARARSRHSDLRIGRPGRARRVPDGAPES